METLREKLKEIQAESKETVKDFEEQDKNFNNLKDHLKMVRVSSKPPKNFNIYTPKETASNPKLPFIPKQKKNRSFSQEKENKDLFKEITEMKVFYRNYNIKCLRVQFYVVFHRKSTKIRKGT